MVVLVLGHNCLNRGRASILILAVKEDIYFPQNWLLHEIFTDQGQKWLYQSYCLWLFKQWSRIFQIWIWYCWKERRMRKIYILQSVVSIFHPLSHPCSPILSPQGNSHNESKLSRLQLLVLSSTFESLIHGTTRKKSFCLSWVRCHMLRSLATNHGRVTNSQVVPQILPKFAA